MEGGGGGGGGGGGMGGGGGCKGSVGGGEDKEAFEGCERVRGGVGFFSKTTFL